MNRSTQLRMRRVVRRRQKQVEIAAHNAGESFEYNLIGRFDRLLRVKRFAFGWILLIVLLTFCAIFQTMSLSGYYQKAQPAPGGIYNEGMVGTYSNANPIFATGSVDTAVSHLIFAGLFKYNDKNQLVGNLASGYHVDPEGKHYVVKLKPNLTWQDGQPLTAQDVVFTFHLIQNPDVDSPLAASWQGIRVTAPDKQTIDFDLPNAFVPFPYGLTTGIIPEHILSKVPASQLRANSFNTTKPVGAGPFAWQAIQANTNLDPDKAVSLIALQPFRHFVGGAPKLSGYVLHIFGSKQLMIDAFQNRDINAMAGLDEMPNSLSKAKDITATSFSSTAATMAFFKTSSGILADQKIRQALVQGADTASIISSLRYPAKAVTEPFLSSQFSYDPKYKQAPYNPANANAILDADGWVRGKNGMRSKGGQLLSFSLYAEDTAENHHTAGMLVKDWEALGINVSPVYQQLTDFETTLEFHTYDALLYGISIGVDPDVYPYWDSSQADIRSTARLNFSEYKSASADTSLEAGRTRLDPKLRVIKYKPFLQAWQSDAPALGLYQPRFLYISRGPVYGLVNHTLNTDADRYYSVEKWEIRSHKVSNK